MRFLHRLLLRFIRALIARFFVWLIVVIFFFLIFAGVAVITKIQFDFRDSLSVKALLSALLFALIVAYPADCISDKINDYFKKRFGV